MNRYMYLLRNFHPRLCNTSLLAALQAMQNLGWEHRLSTGLSSDATGGFLVDRSKIPELMVPNLEGFTVGCHKKVVGISLSTSGHVTSSILFAMGILIVCLVY